MAGVSVIDEGPDHPDKERRFKLTWWGQTSPSPDGYPGLRLAFFPDGLNWTPYERNPVLPCYGEEWLADDPRRPYGVCDIVDAFWDPIRGRFSILVKTTGLKSDGWVAAPKASHGFRRLVSQTVSDDFMRWERPWRVVVPEARDEGLLEFYSVGGIIARANSLTAFVRMLHDDYAAGRQLHELARGSRCSKVRAGTRTGRVGV